MQVLKIKHTRNKQIHIVYLRDNSKNTIYRGEGATLQFAFLQALELSKNEGRK